MSEYKWNVPIKCISPTPIGKLVRGSFPANVDKFYIDEKYNVFTINFRTGEKQYQYSTYKL